MKLFTKAVLDSFVKQGDTSEMEMSESKVLCKLYDCAGGSTWYLVEYDPETNRGFGLCVLNGDYQMAELGYVCVSELQRVLGWRLERDRYFKVRSLEEVYNDIKAGKHV